MNSRAGLPLIQFAEGLQDAVHDKQHELTDTVAHYWDASALAFPVFGFAKLEASYPDIPRRAKLERIVEACYSAGILGPISLLPGHAREFRQLAADEGNYPSPRDLQAFLRSHESRLRRVDEFAEKHLHGHEELSATQVSELGNWPPEVFVVLESLVGTPKTRVEGWMQPKPPLLTAARANLAELGYDNPIFEDLLATMNRIRPGSDQRRSNIIDALSVAQVIDKTASDTPWPRFYTTSPSLNMLVRLDWVRELLSFELPERPGIPGTAIREPYYYFLRSLFPSLVLGRGTSEEHPTLQDLIALSAELSDLDLHKGPNYESLIREYKFPDGRRLREYVDDFLSFGMLRVWQRFDPTGIARRLQASSSAIAASIGSQSAREAIGSRWDELVLQPGQLEEIDQSVGLATSLASRLRRAIEPANDAEVFASDDIYAWRWCCYGGVTSSAVGDAPDNTMSPWLGLGLQADFHTQLLAIAKQHLSEANQPTAHGLLPYVRPDRLRQHGILLNSVMAILYGLEDFERVLSLLPSVSDHPQRVEWGDSREEAWLRSEQLMIHAAAELQLARNDASPRRIAHVASRCVHIWESTPSEYRSYLASGYLHTLTQALIHGDPGLENSHLKRLQGAVADVRRGYTRWQKGMEQARSVFILNAIAYAECRLMWSRRDSEDFSRVLEAEMLGEYVRSARFARLPRLLDTVTFYRFVRAVMSSPKSMVDTGAELKELLATFRDLAERTRDEEIQQHARYVLAELS